MTFRAGRLGPVARRFLSRKKWADQYPAHKCFADELEELVAFVLHNGRGAQFLPRLNARDRDRNKTLSELRVAYFFAKNGFPVVEWEPPGLGTRRGEFVLSVAGRERVFVEVKSRGWESELSRAQIEAGRPKQPKYQQGEGGAFGNWDAVHACINDAYSKFRPDSRNLLVIADDLKISLFESLHHVDIALYADHCMYGSKGAFTSAQYANVGAFGVFGAGYRQSDVQYEFCVFPNPFALPKTAIPRALLAFKAARYNDEWR